MSGTLARVDLREGGHLRADELRGALVDERDERREVSVQSLAVE